MKIIELLGHVDNLHRLSAQAPPEVPPGPVQLSIVISSNASFDNDADGAQWMSGVSREWSDELGDARQDIYSLTDGEPVDATR